MFRAASIAAGVAMLAFLTQDPPRSAVWAYGGGPEQIRYSPLTAINRDNVKQLEVAWTYDTGETGALQTQPVVVGDVLYGYTPSHKTFAIDAATGAPLWTFDPGIKGSGPNRGVMYWQSGAERRVFAAVDNFIYALDPADGKPIAAFGSGGRIDLREGLVRDPAQQGVRLTTPGVVYKDLMIVGGRVGESLPTSPGDIRAYDVRSGALRWSFHTIPHPGEAGHETWPKQAWEYSGGANNWPGMALDETTGVLYVPTGSAASDFYGADRAGDDLFANCLLALDAATGKRVWHFQFVRHDLWDRDPPAPPSLVTVMRDGRRVAAVAQATKQGYVFLFDRANGTPLFPIKYSRYPASTVPGEMTAAEQPLPVEPAPFARQRLTPDLLTTRTPAAHAWAVEQLAGMRSEGQFVPFGVDRPTVVFPGYDGGAEYGGQAFDPETGLYYVNANDLAWTGQLAPSTGGQSGRALYLQHCALCHRDDRAGTPPQIPSLVGLGAKRSFADVAGVVRKGAGRMPGYPALSQTALNAIVQYVLTGEDTQPPPRNPALVAAHPGINNDYRFTGYKKFLDPDGYPAVAPPWGTLNAIDLNTGKYAWKVPLGEYPELVASGMKDTGSENYGGPVVTAGGLVFIAATNHDRKIRAFDKATGALLWEAVLPSSGNATPAVYQSRGRQFVVIAAGGGKSPQGGPGGKYVAFALPVTPQATRAARPDPLAARVDPYVEKQRVVVMSDIANEPDDQMSLVRFLVYSNEFDVEGLIATTSTWMRQRIRPDVMRTVVDAYEQVRPSLLAHRPGFPPADVLRALIVAGQPSYGMAAVGPDKMSAGAELLLRVADKPDPRPLWVLGWGGTNTLAQALLHARATRSAADLDRLVARLRVYAISDQDDAGAWIRREFPGLHYIASPSTQDGEQYYFGTWTGISGDRFYKNSPGADFTTFTDAWVNANIRAKGPLGKHYPMPCCIHEGDTPSFLGLIDNGLASFMSPTYGGWGGRYVWRTFAGETRPFWTQGGDAYPGKDSSRDTVVGADGKAYTSDQATIWRWREAFQHDFAARMDWTIQGVAHANHNPDVVVNGQRGKGPIAVEARAGVPLTLDAAGTTDRDGNALTYRWFFYPEAGTGIPGRPVATGPEVQIGGGGTREQGGIPSAAAGGPREPPARVVLTDAASPRVTVTPRVPGVAHVILSVEDNGTPTLTSYRRVILTIK